MLTYDICDSHLLYYDKSNSEADRLGTVLTSWVTTTFAGVGTDALASVTPLWPHTFIKGLDHIKLSAADCDNQ